MPPLNSELLSQAFRHMATARQLTLLYEENFKQVSKYVHATSRGHEAIQIALGLQLKPSDFVSPYYRDDAMLLSIGISPYELMLQLMAKRDDIFSGGRSYYCHPSLRDAGKPGIIHQSSATGMQAIPTTGIALGLHTKKATGLASADEESAVVVCSLGDASVTEGEVAEAFQVAALKQLPIIYLVQDNGWDISATAAETRAMDAHEYAKGFKGIEALSIDGTDFDICHQTLASVIDTCRRERRPFLVHARVPLLNHHTSGVRKEWYRDDLLAHDARDPYPKMKALMLANGFNEEELMSMELEVTRLVKQDFDRAQLAEDPKPEDLYLHDFAPTTVTEEIGERSPAEGEEKVMVDCALFAIQQMMEDDTRVLLYGQDVGKRLGGVFREASTLGDKFGDFRVFNTAIQEAFIVGSTAGMSAVGLKPIVEVQFADYIWPGLNQLFTEVSRSCYLSNGKYPVNMTLRVPIGAYGSGGPYHSSSVESIVTNIRGIKIAYPSTGADLFGLLKAAVADPNPVVIFEHKGLYWSKVKGTDAARTVLPSRDYVLPFGKGRIVLEAESAVLKQDNAVLIVTYGMGVHWALNAAKNFEGRIGILDLRTLYPLDEDLIYSKARQYHRIMVVTEEGVDNGFAQSLAARIQQHCFEKLDAPVVTVGSANLPAIPLNETLERTFVFSAEKLTAAIDTLLKY
ncbi:MAG: tungsten formylmethanofuran dehydrogenase [Saprospiraceae bacterium]|nr:tungsten formylmethanofuran dehydrogenase [Saprospiraceae bacterium]